MSTSKPTDGSPHPAKMRKVDTSTGELTIGYRKLGLWVGFVVKVSTFKNVNSNVTYSSSRP